MTKEEQKKALFLYVAGIEVQEIFETLTAEGKTYKDAKEVLDKYFESKVNVRYERFITIIRVTGFIFTRLRKLASTCEFHDVEDVSIDQIIEKCSSHKLRKKLLQEKH